VIGVLYIEGREGHIFSEDNVAVLQTLADQIAAAIENTRLLERMQATMQELEVASGQYTQEAWQTLARTRTRSYGYRYRRMGTEPVSEQHPEAQQAWMEGRPVVTTTSQVNDEGEAGEEVHAAAVPIRLRDQIIGVFNLRSSETPISSEALALVEEIAGRLALSLESARLLEETRQRAARERLTREITDRMRRAVSVDRIVQTTVDELHRALGTDRAFVRLGATPPDEDAPVDDNGKGKKES
jgi:GAF domain-containing protein